MSDLTIRLQVQLLDYWHVGSGRGRGAHLDAVVDLDCQALPYVPGKMLKGVLRNAAHCLVAWGHADKAAVNRLFGVEGVAGDLSVTDARLPSDVATYLAEQAQAGLRRQLFAEHFSTAIEHDSGCAQDKSLRGIESVIPCTMFAEVGLPQQDADLLQRILPLVRSLGAHRSRGFGRCELSLAKG